MRQCASALSVLPLDAAHGLQRGCLYGCVRKRVYGNVFPGSNVNPRNGDRGGRRRKVGLKGCKPEAWNASKGHTIEGSPHPSVLQTASFDYSYNTLSFCATKYYRRASNLICRKPLENGNFFVSSYTRTLLMLYFTTLCAANTQS